MTSQKAAREQRVHALRLAIHRVKLGRVRNIPSGTKMSVVAVAKEAGIHPSTIHTTYPEVIDEIQKLVGKSLRERRRGDLSEMKKCKAKLEQARKEITSLKLDLASMTSRYAATILQNEHLVSLLSPQARALHLRTSRRMK